MTVDHRIPDQCHTRYLTSVIPPVAVGAEFCDLKAAFVTIIFLLITASTIVALIFLAAFTWAVRSGQFEDDRAPAVRILGDHLPTVKPDTTSTPRTNNNDRKQ